VCACASCLIYQFAVQGLENGGRAWQRGVTWRQGIGVILVHVIALA